MFQSKRYQHEIRKNYCNNQNQVLKQQLIGINIKSIIRNTQSISTLLF